MENGISPKLEVIRYAGECPQCGTLIAAHYQKGTATYPCPECNKVTVKDLAKWEAELSQRLIREIAEEHNIRTAKCS